MKCSSAVAEMLAGWRDMLKNKKGIILCLQIRTDTDAGMTQAVKRIQADPAERPARYGWSCGKDGASLISCLLFEEATDINFYVGKAINPAHQNPNLPINFNIKMNLVQELSEALKKMGKRIKVSYF